MKLGSGTFQSPEDIAEGIKSFTFALLPPTHKGAQHVSFVEKDCVCVKRVEGVSNTVQVNEFVSEVGLSNHDGTICSHSRPQPARGPRKLQAGAMRFVPEFVAITDQSEDTCGQLIPSAPLKSFCLFYEMKFDANHIGPTNGVNSAILATRKQIVIPCLRVVRVGVLA